MSTDLEEANKRKRLELEAQELELREAELADRKAEAAEKAARRALLERMAELIVLVNVRGRHYDVSQNRSSLSAREYLLYLNSAVEDRRWG